jgi:hypothetical protein
MDEDRSKRRTSPREINYDARLLASVVEIESQAKQRNLRNVMAKQYTMEPPRKSFTGLIVALLVVQLRLALALLEDLGGGIILYLTRRPRAWSRQQDATYQLQHDGIDTFDTNSTLGFDEMRAITASPHACFGC